MSLLNDLTGTERLIRVNSTEMVVEVIGKICPGVAGDARDQHEECEPWPERAVGVSERGSDENRNDRRGE